MRGTPVIRLILLVLFLGGAGVLVGWIAGPDASKNAPIPEPRGPGTGARVGAEVAVDAYAQIRISSPAKRIVLDGETIRAPLPFDFRAGELGAELEFPMMLREGRMTADVLGIEWTDLSQPNFAHLTIEPEGLETREVTLHFPAGERTAALEFRWPQAND